MRCKPSRTLPLAQIRIVDGEMNDLPDPKWIERPLALLVAKPAIGRKPTYDSIVAKKLLAPFAFSTASLPLLQKPPNREHRSEKDFFVAPEPSIDS